MGKRVGEWVYELFITMLGADGFLVEDVLDLYQGRGAFEAVLADEDVEEDPDRWCSYTECGQELWQIACQWVWNLRLSLGQTMQGGQAPRDRVGPCQRSSCGLRQLKKPHRKNMARGSGLRRSDEPRGVSGPRTFVLQEDGKLRCPAGASLWLSEVRQENAFTQRAVVPSLPDGLSTVFCCGSSAWHPEPKGIEPVA